MSKKLKSPIKYKIDLDEGQREVKQAIYDNQIVVVTGKAGSGKTAMSAQTALDMIFTKEISDVIITRPAVEVGRTLGYLKGDLSDKFSAYIEPFMENLYKCYDREKIDKHIEKGQITSVPVQFIRGKTIGTQQLLLVEESQNLSKHEMLAILSRLGKNGRIVVSGDNKQSDIKEKYTGLHFAIELSKAIEDIKWFDLKSNHRSELVGKILDYEENKF